MLAGVQQLGVHVPSWFSARDSVWLSGYIEDTELSEHLSLDSFLKGDLQASFDSAIGNHIPMKAEALLTSASIQRTFIGGSNSLFRMECYPSYYGSNEVYIPSVNALANWPRLDMDNVLASVKDFSMLMLSFAETHPDKRFHIIFADISSSSNLNPACAYLKVQVCAADCYAAAKEIMSGVNNVDVTFRQYSDLRAYYRDYYTTDHHWNGFGALAAYNQMIENEPSEQLTDGPYPSESFPSLYINGSTARGGLMMLNEVPNEPDMALWSYPMTASISPPLLKQRGGVRMISYLPESEFNFYHAWYGPSSSVVIQNNSKEAQGRKALVLGDSYTSAMQWLIARSHESTYTFLDLHGGYSGSESLEDRIAESGADDIYFVACAGGFNNLFNCYPRYFEQNH